MFYVRYSIFVLQLMKGKQSHLLQSLRTYYSYIHDFSVLILIISSIVTLYVLYKLQTLLIHARPTIFMKV